MIPYFDMSPHEYGMALVRARAYSTVELLRAEKAATRVGEHSLAEQFRVAVCERIVREKREEIDVGLV